MQSNSCQLCLQDKPLENSHVIPAFAGRYLVRTSATGFLRDGMNPNVRRQGLPTERLFCRECEAILSKYEREFATDYFPILQDDQFNSLNYGENLLRFAVSLHFRILITTWGVMVGDISRHQRNVTKIRENWRRYLLGEISSPGGEHHLFVFAGIPNGLPSHAHEKFLDYVLRGIDGTPIVSSTSVAVYVKLIRCIFYSPIVPKIAKGWGKTRIYAGPGRILSPQALAMPGFLDFMNLRATEAFARPISDNQNQKIAETMKADPDRTIASESFRVGLARHSINQEKKF